MSESVVVSVWKKLGAGLGWGLVTRLDSYESLSVEPRHNAPGVWSLVLPVSDQAAKLTKTRLVTFDYVGTRVTGVVTNSGPTADETGKVRTEVAGITGLGLLGDLEFWPNPAEDITAQTATHYVATGPAETVLRSAIYANLVTRLGEDVVFPASLGRGATVKLKEAFSNVLAVSTAKATRAGIAIHMGLVNTTSSTRAEMRVSFSVPDDKSNRVRLSHKVGTLRTWKQTDTAPTATRVVVAGILEQAPKLVDTISLANDTFTTTAAHNLRTGSTLKLSGDRLPKDLSASTTYYAVRVDANTFKVAATQNKALAGTTLPLTEAGYRVESIDTANTGADANTITLTTEDAPRTGVQVQLLQTNNPPAPLTSGTSYYAIRKGKDRMQVATSEANANVGTAIDLTGVGAGDLFFYPAGMLTATESRKTMRLVIDAAAEAAWGRKIETYVDVSTEDGDDVTALIEAGNEKLAEMVAQSSFELEAVEATGMRYGEHFNLGDRVLVELMTGVSSVQRLGGVKLASDMGGTTVQLIPGNPDSANPMFAQAAITRGIRRDLDVLRREEV